MELGERYARATGYPIQYQWTLLDGINDGDDELDAHRRLLAGKYAVMNFIPYNTVDGLGVPAPDRGARRGDGARCCTGAACSPSCAHSAGQDVEGGCGQLRARAAATGAGPRVAVPIVPAR